MRTRSRWALCGAALLAPTIGVALALGAPSTAASPSATLANSVTYQDSTGEDPNALDIGTVTVSNNDAGLVTFDVRFVNGSISSATDALYVVLNTDRDESTGDPDASGADWVAVWRGTPLLRRWNGTDFQMAPSMRTLVTLVQPSGLVLRLDTSEIGDVTGFEFYVKTYRPNPSDPEGEFSDWAPEWNLWSYDVKVYVPPVLSATAVRCTPEPPRAGRPMVARMTVKVTRGTATEPLGTGARVKATATVAGRRMAGTVLPGYAGGKVAVRWNVPKAAKGKTMRGTITVTLERVSITRAFVDHVR